MKISDTVNKTTFARMIGLTQSRIRQLQMGAWRALGNKRVKLYCGSIIPSTINYSFDTEDELRKLWSLSEVELFIKNIDKEIFKRSGFKMSYIDYDENNKDIPLTVKRTKQLTDEWMEAYNNES